MGLQASDGFELDDDPSRIDPDVVWRYLSGWSYWGRGRTRAFVIQTIERSSRVVGLSKGLCHENSLAGRRAKTEQYGGGKPRRYWW